MNAMFIYKKISDYYSEYFLYLSMLGQIPDSSITPRILW
jgi:hypothetical protein